ncbi:MAG: uroporphyrinogen decarboxylase family protein [Victivallaceae bacterium]|nr:uroporphyrinogen decarboxylase family protein [Victivallaceae bacterium]
MTLTKKERVLRVLQGKTVDKLPVETWINSKLARDKYKRAFQVTEEEFLLKLNKHIIYIEPQYVGFIKAKDNIADLYDEWGCGWQFPLEGNKEESAIDTIHPLEGGNIKEYIFPEIDNYKFNNIQLELKKNGDNLFVPANQAGGTLFSRVRYLRGYENALIDMLQDRRGFEYLLDKITDYQIEKAHRFIELGVHGLLTGDDVAQQTGLLFDPKLWRELIKPRQKKINMLYKEKGLPIIHHCCGNCMEIIEDLIEIGVDCLNPVQSESMSIEELSKKFGGRITFHGGISVQKVLPFGSPGDVFREVSKCIEILGKHGRYIIGVTHEIESNVPPENIEAYFNAIEKYNT